MIEREREHIRSKFPDDYHEYERNVPAFVPRAVPWRAHGTGVERDRFDLSLYLRHREWQAALAYVAVILFLILKMQGAIPTWSP